MQLILMIKIVLILLFGEKKLYIQHSITLEFLTNKYFFYENLVLNNIAYYIVFHFV